MARENEIAASTPVDCILVDWGTSSLRLWVLDGAGKVLARRASPDGMGTLEPDEYEGRLLALAGDFLPAGDAPPEPVIICGMAGARNGWKEAPYRSVPCEPVAGGNLTPVETDDRRIAVSIVPGLSQASPPDVMRGEETQLAGLISSLGIGDAIVCLPGTHSKWVRLEACRVDSFSTFMTGELFAVISAHSILRHSVGGEGFEDAAFLSAVGEMLERPRDLTRSLFSIRAGSLLEGLGATAAQSRLSGLLIGAELAAAETFWRGRTVHLIGADLLSKRYAAAIEAAGGTATCHDAEALTLAGLSMARTRQMEENDHEGQA